jgi:hypothetical protein
MTSDAFRPRLRREPFNGVLAAAKLGLVSILTFVGYVGFFIVYTTIFLISIVNLGFLEIRQVNMQEFNALTAMVSQRDRLLDDRLHVPAIHADIASYRSFIASLICSDVGGNAVVTEPNGGETCAEIKQTAAQHLHELTLTEDDLRFRSANLLNYYEQYIDGLSYRMPQIGLIMLMLDFRIPLISLMARSPAVNEIFLVICMGVLGGLTSVMRSFVDPSQKRVIFADLFYRPLAGAVIALGIYVLFRAAQIFLGVQAQDSAASGSTSIFVLAGLGLASGFCAIEALGQIELVAKRLLRSSGHVPNNHSGSGDNAQGFALDPRRENPGSRPSAHEADPRVIGSK